jgi:hypothetical protein
VTLFAFLPIIRLVRQVEWACAFRTIADGKPQVFELAPHVKQRSVVNHFGNPALEGRWAWHLPSFTESRAKFLSRFG